MALDNLRKMRTLNSLNQKDMANYLGIDRTTYVKYETGGSEPDLKTLMNLAEYFNTTTSYLIGETDDPTRPGQPYNPPYSERVENIRKQFESVLNRDISTEQIENLISLFGEKVIDEQE